MVGLELAAACLALNIYHEAAFEPLYGQYAVAFVTLNRARKRHLEICDVVFQDSQFSWTKGSRDVHGKLYPRYIPHGENWKRAKWAAHRIINGDQQDFTGGATHYHADYIRKPVWAHSMQPVGKWGHHYFYR